MSANPVNERKQSAKNKIIVGSILAILGIIGFIKSPKIKNRKVRLVGFASSGLAVFAGAYLFILGASDLAIARIGTSPLGEKLPGAMVYENPEALKAGLELTFKSQPDIRRLRFACKDKSESFRVFNTAAGTYGIPDSNVQCADGSYLVYYSQK